MFVHLSLLALILLLNLKVFFAILDFLLGVFANEETFFSVALDSHFVLGDLDSLLDVEFENLNKTTI